MLQADKTISAGAASPSRGNGGGLFPARVTYSWGDLAHDRLMGFERPRPQQFKAEREVPGPHYPYLGDYLEFAAGWEDEVEAEHSTWPELIDQTRLAKFCGPWDFDDMEEDDACGGDVVDEHHDAREEDGI